jgi:hypothetical protein
MVFYATSGGVVFEPFSDQGKQGVHDKSEARQRLSEKLAARRETTKPDKQAVVETVNEELESKSTTLQHNGNDDDNNNNDQDEAERELRLIETRLQNAHLDLEAVHQEKACNKFLAREFQGKKGECKAIPSNYVYQPCSADNAAKRAIVHHTGSHYHMAGSRQFQKGVRVKGTISRHSKQGAKLQAARISSKNMLTAREDARGERFAGGKSLGKSTKKQKSAEN